MNENKFYKVFFFIVLATMGLIVSIIYYEYLAMIFPEESSLFIFPFNTTWFVFGATYAIIIPVAIYLSKGKIKKKIQELNKKRSL